MFGPQPLPVHRLLRLLALKRRRANFGNAGIGTPITPSSTTTGRCVAGPSDPGDVGVVGIVGDAEI